MEDLDKTNPKSTVIGDCERLRDEAASAPYTVAHAIGDARWIQRTPDAVLSPERAKKVITTLLAAIEVSPCFTKAVMLGMRPFVILPYDRAGHHALARWIVEAESHGCRQEKVEDARAMHAQWLARPDLSWPK